MIPLVFFANQNLPYCNSSFVSPSPLKQENNLLALLHLVPNWKISHITLRLCPEWAFEK